MRLQRWSREHRERRWTRRWLLAWLLPWLCLNFFSEALHHPSDWRGVGLSSASRAPVGDEARPHPMQIEAGQAEASAESCCLACAWAAGSVGVSAAAPWLPGRVLNLHAAPMPTRRDAAEVVLHRSSRGPPLD